MLKIVYVLSDRERLVYCLTNVVMQCLTLTRRGRVRYTMFRDKGSLARIRCEKENTHLSVNVCGVTVINNIYFLLFAEQK